jgi:hypothetical protein
VFRSPNLPENHDDHDRIRFRVPLGRPAEGLKARYPTVRDTILFCLHALTENPDAEIDDLKALANQHGLRVTAASVNGAKTLLARASMAPEPKAKETAEDATEDEQPRPRRPRVTEPTADTDALIRGLVGKLEARSSAEADKMHEAMRRAIGILTAACGS